MCDPLFHLLFEQKLLEGQSPNQSGCQRPWGHQAGDCLVTGPLCPWPSVGALPFMLHCFPGPMLWGHPWVPVAPLF